ncbi:DNA repair protein RecN [Paludicola sp. MB14-C6]|uniref:DNA repair protein RecN n=1 Tax=Paludihabitans sp. MB14-C6 TaxID=3070656 RepID=UPI0027DBF8C0|nr:DNA repair protein RecN [Paludicola sp. MB14-C6]WMJ23039.1 DNA repair protein RecN [Paludicola sp. MB14-C6]
MKGLVTIMLCELYIENLAVIEKTSIQLGTGLNVFTGETGAGKSIVIDAINVVLGQRTSKEIVRYNTSKATITAIFTDISKSAFEKLKEYGYEQDYLDEQQLLITREISADQKSVARIMGKPVTVAILREIGTELINIHGQHDNQVLLAPERHIDILDKYGDYTSLLEQYHACFKQVVLIKREMKKISVNEQEKAQRIDLLTYQIDEISSASLKSGEDVKLEAKQNEIKNKTKIIEGLQAAYQALSGLDDEGGAVELCQTATQSFEEITEVYEPANVIYTKLEGLSAELEEVAADIANQLDEFDFNQNTIDAIETRLDEIHKLKRKYGDSIDEILSYAEECKQELESLELSDQRLAELSKQGTIEYQRLLELANEITKQREIASKRFIQSVTSELQFLDMPNVSLEVKQDHVKPNAKGQDAIEFLISTNKGEPPKPIAKIASGGELSRIMLAIKNTLADKDEIQTLIFDEIDTGVSGRAAQKIGLKLSQAAKNRQVIAVTHSAQIAALGDHHFLIQKESRDDRTFTDVTKLDYNGRIHEVARIMSTDKITDLMLKNAEEMIIRK